MLENIGYFGKFERKTATASFVIPALRERVFSFVEF
jgi:hypothetical protein